MTQNSEKTMKILGITGGVGSGKSRILQELKDRYHACVVEADRLAHMLMEPGQAVYYRLKQAFGADILQKFSPYAVDRTKLSQIVFNNPEKLALLNQLTHPAVKTWILDDIESKKKQGTSLYVIEAALLIEDGYREICDEIWYVYADEAVRTERLMKQRGYTEARCRAMFASQKSESYYKTYTDFTINNQNNYENSSKQLKDRLNILLGNDILLYNHVQDDENAGGTGPWQQ